MKVTRTVGQHWLELRLRLDTLSYLRLQLTDVFGYAKDSGHVLEMDVRINAVLRELRAIDGGEELELEKA